MSIHIDGFGISGYRSFGTDIQRIGPLSKINIFAGQNNAGKSNILNFLIHQYGPIFKTIQTRGKLSNLSEIDLPIRHWDRIIRAEIGVTHDSDNYKKIFERLNVQGNLSLWLDKILKSDVLSKGTNVAWIPFESSTHQDFSLKHEIIDKLADALPDHRQWQNLWANLTQQGQGGLKQHWIPQTLARVVAQITLPAFSIIPSVRRYSQETSDKDDFSGIGIIAKLAKLQNPNFQEQKLKGSFSNINEFVRVVTGNETATLEIPHDRSDILVNMDEKILPLTSLGTGIHEVIILASAATVLKDQIVCIEEPELHMHPELQKKFIEYLDRETTNQYFITTHSGSILDRPGTSIFHVTLSNGVSKVTPVSSTSQRFSVCTDLGYRASDLVQSNCIIWVEGPSDRIYLKWWIKSLDPTLVEGIHYSIMFYGGRLLSHLSADDPEVGEFISLRRLNQNISIVIDSDKKSKQSEINETKRRV
jgi:predicted ATP-dependent endonuclease of OLD family